MNTTNATAKLANANIVNLADDIIDIFEGMLDRLNITLPDKWREGEEDEARIFGDTYYELEGKIIERLRKRKTECPIFTKQTTLNSSDFKTGAES